MSYSIAGFLENLSGTEKRYINLHLKKFSDSDNISLNDFISFERQAGKNKGAVKPKGNVTRLYYRLLDILAEYHRDNLNNNSIDQLNLNRAKLLFYKGYHAEAEKLVGKILSSPLGNNHLIKVEAIELRLIHSVNAGKINYLSSQFEEDKLNLKTISDEYTNLINYQILWAASKFETSSGYFFDHNSTFSEKQYANYLSDESNAISPMAKILYNKLKGYEAIKTQNIEAAFNYTKRAIQIFHQHRGLIQSNTVEYLKSNRNYAIALNFQNRTKDAEDYIHLIQKITDPSILNKNAAIKIESYILFVMMRMDLIINGQTINEQDPEFTEFEKRYQEMRDLLPQDEAMTSSFHFTLFYLNSKTPRKALKCINYILKNKGSARRDIYHLALIAELVAHFKLDNIDLMESKLKSYKKYLAQNGSVFGFEKEVFSFFTKLIKEPENGSHIRAVLKLANKTLSEEKKSIYLHYNPLQYLRI